MSAADETANTDGKAAAISWQKVVVFVVSASAIVAVVWLTGSADAAALTVAALLPLLYWLSGKPSAQ